MSKFGNCVACDSRFHYSETSELTVRFDIDNRHGLCMSPARASFWAPDVCMSCEAEIQNA